MGAAFVLFFGSLVGGFYGSVVGSAGLVSVSLLTLVGLPPSIAVATSRPAGMVLEATSALRYYREGALRWGDIRIGLLLGASSACGGVIGALLVSRVPETALSLLFAVAMAGLGMAGLDPTWTQRFARPSGNRPVELAGTFVLGIYGGFFAFVYATLLMLFLVWRGRTFLQSAVQSRIVGLCMSTAAATTFALQGTIDYALALPVALGFGLGGWLGAGVGVRRGEPYIRWVIRCVVFLAVGTLLVDVLR